MELCKILWLLAVVHACCGQDDFEEDDEMSQIKQFINEVMEVHNVPGMIVAIVKVTIKQIIVVIHFAYNCDTPLR